MNALGGHRLRVGAGAGVSDGGKSVAVGEYEAVGFNGEDDEQSRRHCRYGSLRRSLLAVNVSIDQAALTGESLPRRKKIGGGVIGCASEGRNEEPHP